MTFKLSGTGDGEIRTEDGEIIKRALKLRMEQAGEKAVTGITGVLREEAREVQLLAQAYAPFSAEGEAAGYPHLEDAIEVREEKQEGRKVAFTVFVNGRRTGHNGKPVGSYAFMVHEGMLPGGSGEINRGVGTQVKGPHAGGKFLERAYRDSAARIKRRVEAQARSVFAKGKR